MPIYTQAQSAEANALSEICGGGYRKALEFLVKDYVVKHRCSDDSEREAVLKLMLGPCIDKFLDDPRLQGVARRAAWLGNDETHYYRRWSDKDLADLKTLIDMTVTWTDLVIASADYARGMPDPATRG